MILNVFLVSDIGVCESTFSAVLKPHRHNPDCRDVTAIRKGHGSIPTAHTRHDELFSLSLFFLFSSHGCMSCHLGVCRVIIDGLPRWCVDRTLERRSVFLSVSLSARFPGYLSACSLYQFKKLTV